MTNLAMKATYADLAEIDYSIRIPEVPGRALCGSCQVEILAEGPTGFAGYDPICNRCLLAGSEKLGMVIALVAHARSFAQIPGAKASWNAMEELGKFCVAFAKVMAR